MAKLSDIALSKIDTIRPNSTASKVFKSRGVQRTSEFKRIARLPRHDWESEFDIHAVAAITDWLKKEKGGMSLFPIQAAALAQIYEIKGGFFPIGVGGGKALVSVLAPVVLQAERPILLVPADLREQTKKKVVPEMQEHWTLHPNLKVIAFSELSLEKNAEMLDDLKPDLIVIDEAHALKNMKAGRTRRVGRYMAENPTTMVIVLSGTMSNRSLRDYWHLMAWAMKEDLMPLPTNWNELSAWSDALDEGVDESARVGAGVLLELDGEVGESDELTEARKAYRRRLVRTPGVVASSEDQLGTSLVIRRRHVQPPAKISKLMRQLRETWEDPNGDPLIEAIDVWRIMRQLALGFWYRWEPKPPVEWLDARSAWKKYVRHTLRHNRRKLDTELQVFNEVRKKVEDGEEFATFTDWINIRDSFKINTVIEWEDDFAIKAIAEWVEETNEGIVWTEHARFAERLSKELKIPYYGAGKKDSFGILDASGVIIASIRSHGQGKNLQHFAKNLVTAPPTSGKIWEQLVGRTHRHKQQADTVEFDVFLHAPELFDSFGQARADARYLEDSLTGRQKLNFASILI